MFASHVARSYSITLFEIVTRALPWEGRSNLRMRTRALQSTVCVRVCCVRVCVCARVCWVGGESAHDPGAAVGLFSLLLF